MEVIRLELDHQSFEIWWKSISIYNGKKILFWKQFDAPSLCQIHVFKIRIWHTKFYVLFLFKYLWKNVMYFVFKIVFLVFLYFQNT